MLAKFLNFLLLVTLAAVHTRAAITKCEKSVTTTSGSKAVNEKKVCSGDLIFEESFDGALDMDIWQHDSTFAGDTVCSRQTRGEDCCQRVRNIQFSCKKMGIFLEKKILLKLFFACFKNFKKKSKIT